MAEQGDEDRVLQEENAAGAASAEKTVDSPTSDNVQIIGAESSGPMEDEMMPTGSVEEVALPANQNPTSAMQEAAPLVSDGPVSDDPAHGLQQEAMAGPSDFKVPTVSKKREAAQLSDSPSRQSQAQDDDGKNKSRVTGLSPAEQLKHKQAPIPYKEPAWSGVTEKPYSFDVVKNGVIIDTVKLTKSFYVFGRLPGCDMVLEHPSLSRFHAVVQFCGKPDESHAEGWYVYDLGSTHGTTLNKNQLKHKVYYRLKVGHILKFAGSSRLHILQGPEEDEEEESQLTVTELKARRLEREREKLMEATKKEEEEKAEVELAKQKEEDEGCSWGMGADADPEADNPFQMTELPENEHLYIDDPKKALKNFFEREGWDLPDYQFSDQGWGKHRCHVELPIDTASGEPLIAEVTVTGKKKDAVIACALEACRLLDRHGELRKSHQVSRKKKAKNWEDNDFYDSDEDTFLDRTGNIEKKRQKRMKRAGKVEEKAESFASLSLKLQNVESEMKSIDDRLAKAKEEAAQMEAEEVDALDAYMSSIKSGAMDTKTKMSLKRRLFDLRKEQAQLQKLVNIARPANLPPIISSSLSIKAGGKTGAMFRKIRGGARPLPKMITSQTPKISMPEGDVEEEEDEDEDNDGGVTEKQVSQVIKEKTISERLSPPTESLSDTVDIANVQTKVTVSDAQAIVQKSKAENASNRETVIGSDSGKNKLLSDASKHKKDEIDKDKSQGPDTQADVQNTEVLKKKGKLRASIESPPEFVSPPSKKRAVDTNQMNRKKEKSSSMGKSSKGPHLSSDYTADDPDYAVWLPPKGQTGDGKTHLNAKYGY